MLTSRSASSDLFLLSIRKLELLVGQFWHFDGVKNRHFSGKSLVEGGVHMPPVWPRVSVIQFRLR